jgi:hypothetical protein
MLMDLSFINENSIQNNIPTALSFKRNGNQHENPNKRLDKKFVADEDKDGKFFGASIRRGPHMSVQEDRVSRILNRTLSLKMTYLNPKTMLLILFYF